MTARPSRIYGLAACVACFTTNIDHEPTGATRTEMLKFQTGRKVLHQFESKDLGPRFGPEHAREQAEIRCTSCGAASWSLSPQAIEDARAKNEGRALAELPALEDVRG